MFFLHVHGQVIKGRVVDSKSGEPLKYVSIGIIDTPLGTISDENGNFSFDVKKQPQKALIRFSMIGFESGIFTVEEVSANDKPVKLVNKPVELAEVVIRTGRLRQVGTDGYTWHKGYCGWGGTDFGRGFERGYCPFA